MTGSVGPFGPMSIGPAIRGLGSCIQQARQAVIDEIQCIQVELFLIATDRRFGWHTEILGTKLDSHGLHGFDEIGSHHALLSEVVDGWSTLLTFEKEIGAGMKLELRAEPCEALRELLLLLFGSRLLLQ